MTISGYSPMTRREIEALKEALWACKDRPYRTSEQTQILEKGRTRLISSRKLSTDEGFRGEATKVVRLIDKQIGWMA